MIVFIDTQKGEINIVDDGNLYVIDLDDIESIQSILRNKRVLYVTEFVETTGIEILKTIGDNDVHEESIEAEDDVTSKMYLHVTHPYKTYIQHEGREYIFAGKSDAKCIDDLPVNFLTACEQVSNGIKTGIFEIIDENRRQELITEKERSPIARLKKANADSKSRGSLDEPIEIDLSGSASFKRDK